jgi:hypothetical protein
VTLPIRYDARDDSMTIVMHAKAMSRAHPVPNRWKIDARTHVGSIWREACQFECIFPLHPYSLKTSYCVGCLGKWIPVSHDQLPKEWKHLRSF